MLTKKGLGKGLLAIILSISLILSLGGFGFAYNQSGEDIQQSVEGSSLSESNFHQGDVDVINNLIDNHNLNWERDAVEHWPHDFIGWEAASNGIYRIARLRFDVFNWDCDGIPLPRYPVLTGDLDLRDLSYLENLTLNYQEITGFNVSGLSRLSSISTRGSGNITHVDISGVSESIWFGFMSETLEEFIFPNGSRFTFIRSQEARERVSIIVEEAYNNNRIFLYFEEIGEQFFAFEYWEVTGTTLDEPDNPDIEFHMLDNDVTIRAVYSAGSPNFYQGDIDTINNMIRALDLRWIENDIKGWAFDDQHGTVIGEGIRWSRSNPRRIEKMWYTTPGTSEGYDPARSIDISGLTELRSFIVKYQNISNVEIGNLTNLAELQISGSFSHIDLSGTSNIKNLTLEGQLLEIDLTGMPSLRSLVLRSNELTGIDVTGLSNLFALFLYDNNLTKIDVSGLENLWSLRIFEPNMENIDLSGVFQNGHGGVFQSYYVDDIVFPSGGRLTVSKYKELSTGEREKLSSETAALYIQATFRADWICWEDMGDEGAGDITSEWVNLFYDDRENEELRFSHWEATGIILEEPHGSGPSLWLFMPDNDVEIIAIFVARNLDVLLGDINGDGVVNILDLQLLLRHVSRRNLLTDEQQLLAADVNRDGNVDILDLRLLLQYVSRRISSFD